MTIIVEKPTSVDIKRYEKHIKELKYLLRTNAADPYTREGWRRDLRHYTRLLHWANDNYEMYQKTLNTPKKSLLQRIFRY